VSESSHDLVAAKAARVEEILRAIGSDEDQGDGAEHPFDADSVDDPASRFTIRGSRLWNS
jgi:hypothetical protein